MIALLPLSHIRSCVTSRGWASELSKHVVILSVLVGWFVGWGNECTLVGWCRLGAKVRVRWETDGVCGGRCLMRVTNPNNPPPPRVNLLASQDACVQVT
jgi:hypothetical protein